MGHIICQPDSHSGGEMFELETAVLYILMKCARNDL